MVTPRAVDTRPVDHPVDPLGNAHACKMWAVVDDQRVRRGRGRRAPRIGWGRVGTARAAQHLR